MGLTTPEVVEYRTIAERYDAQAVATITQETDPGTRTVRIPACDEHNGFASRLVTLTWACPGCGGPRGEPYEGISYDGSRRLSVHRWDNPCGHVDKYDAVRAEADEQVTA